MEIERADAPGRGLIATMDAAPLSGRYWLVTGLMMLHIILELYDFFIVGFIVSVVAPMWKLTFGQSTIILLAVGVGMIVGSLVMGRVADVIGRKFCLVFGGLLCALAAGAIAFVPDGNWIAFAALRFFVGFGYASAGIAQLTLMVEYTPTRHRTLMSSIAMAPAALGILLASTVSSSMLPIVGWRGIAALGAVTAVVSVLLWIFAPESARWLISKGRNAQARKVAARMLSQPLENMPEPDTNPAAAPTRASWRELWGQRRAFVLVVLLYLGLNATSTGCYLWGPIVVAQLLDIPAAGAAKLFIYVGVFGILGRIAFSVLPHKIGRRRAAQIGTFGAAAAICGAALTHDAYLGAAPLFVVFLIGGALFWDGVWATIMPYAPEVFPVRMAARGMGLGQAAGGVGKILGPLALGVIAGTSNYITPKATADAVLPGFLFIGCCALISAFAVTFFGIEPHGKTLEEGQSTT